MMEDSLDGLVTIFFLSHVACPDKNVNAACAKILLNLLERFFIHIQDGDPGPPLTEAGTQGGADAARSSGYDHYFIFHFP